MKRWLAWAGGGIVVLAVVIRVSTDHPQSASVQLARPTPATRSFFEDDTLSPPPADASAAEWQAYGKGLDRILSGQDPLVKAGTRVSEHRLTERRRMAQERKEKTREVVQSANNASAALHSQRLAEMRLETEAARGLSEAEQFLIPESSKVQMQALERPHPRLGDLPKAILP